MTTTAHAVPTPWEQSSGCLDSADIWGWQAFWSDTSDYADVLGAPTDTTCYPGSDYQPTSGYFEYATSCPGDSFTACVYPPSKTGGYTTCCPKGSYTFSCATPAATVGTFSFPCYSNYYYNTVLIMWTTVLGENGATLSQYTATIDTTTTITTSGGYPVVYTRSSKDILRAMGLVITATPASPSPTDNTSASTATISPSAATGSGNGRGLSAGVAAGVGIGAAIGALLAFTTVWLAYRRGVRRGMRKGKREGWAAQYRGSEPVPVVAPTNNPDTTGYQKAELPQTSSYRYELPTEAHRHELDGRNDVNSEELGSPGEETQGE